MVSLDGLDYSSHKMKWDFSQTENRDGVLVSAPPLPRLLPLHAAAFSTPYHSIHSYQKDSSPSPPKPSSASKISPAILFIIIVLAVVFFISGLLHLLVRFLMKQPSSSSSSQPNRYPEVRGSDAVQRQLQQLFHLHDSGLDQAFIDSLPVFLYKEIMGLKEPFDCAVCLCEFSEEDKLRLLPLCGHAFHIDCIDTWLLSNSTCPLCRGALYGSGLGIENPIFEFDYAREEDGFSGDEEAGISGGQKPTAEETGGVQKRVFSVRLGKFKSSNANEGGGETSTSNLDGRRCYSMGSYQYVVGDSELQVALCGQKDGDDNGDRDGEKQQQMKRRGGDGSCSIEMDVEGKKLCKQSKGESFSVSKIWLWPKKGKCTSSSDVNVSNGITPFPSTSNVNLPWIERT